METKFSDFSCNGLRTYVIFNFDFVSSVDSFYLKMFYLYYPKTDIAIISKYFLRDILKVTIVNDVIVIPTISSIILMVVPNFCDSN